MNSTTARARLLTAMLMIAGTFSVGLVAESATAAPKFRVTLSVSDATPAVGQLLRLSGKVTPAAPGKRVKLQGRAAGTGWVTIARPRLSQRSTYKASFRFPRAGSVTMRVVKPASGGSARDVSPLRRLRVGGGASAPVIVTASLPNGVVGTPYSATVETADRRPGQFAALGLPAGLSMDVQDGTITGTPTTAGSSSVTVYFRDADRRTTSKAYTLTVAPAGIARALPDITTTSLPNGQNAAAYSTTLGITDNLAGKWMVTAGTLPTGLTLNTTTGVISGTPTATGGPTAFTVTFTETATNFSDAQALSIRVAAAPGPVVTTTSMPPGYVGNPYSVTLLANGGSGTWSLSTGTLPTGLSLNPATGVISGTPTTPSPTPVTSSFTVTFTVPGGLLQPDRSDTQPLTIKIDPDSAPVVSNSSLPDAFVGKAFRDTLTTASNRSGTWAITSGSLPAGLSLKSSTGEISGVPGVAGTASFVVTFTALNGQTDTEDFTLLVKP